MKKIIFLIFIFLFTNSSVFAKETINIAFTIDNNYPLYTMLTINSILQNNVSDSDYNFYIVNNGISTWNKLKMKWFVESQGQQIHFIKTDTYEIDNGKNYFDESECKYITRIGTARILLPKLLPEDIKKVLYLDSDLICNHDISELFNMDLDGNYAAMVQNITEVDDDFKSKLGDNNYHNSGVILIDLDKWRENNITSKLIDFLKNNKTSYPDQDAINIVLKGKIKTLNETWNKQVPELKHYEGIHYKYNIVHYISSCKPWKMDILLSKESKYSPLPLYYSKWKNSILFIYMPQIVMYNAYKKSVITCRNHIFMKNSLAIDQIKYFLGK